MPDELKVEILEDGTIKVDSGRISMANHQNAEAFMRSMSQAAGGKQQRQNKQGLIGAVRHALQHALNRSH